MLYSTKQVTYWGNTLHITENFSVTSHAMSDISTNVSGALCVTFWLSIHYLEQPRGGTCDICINTEHRFTHATSKIYFCQPAHMEMIFSFINDMRCIHYCDVMMNMMASQITSLAIVYLTEYSGTDQRKHQSSASLAFVRRIHRGPVNSPQKWPVTRKMFPFDDVIML